MFVVKIFVGYYDEFYFTTVDSFVPFVVLTLSLRKLYAALFIWLTEISVKELIYYKWGDRIYLEYQHKLLVLKLIYYRYFKGASSVVYSAVGMLWSNIFLPNKFLKPLWLSFVLYSFKWWEAKENNK